MNVKISFKRKICGATVDASPDLLSSRPARLRSEAASTIEQTLIRVLANLVYVSGFLVLSSSVGTMTGSK
jgi:hypothetical protein